MSTPIARLLLTHGAGAGTQSDFIQKLAERLRAQQLDVVLFDFAYMEKMKATGKRRPPSPISALLQELNDAVNRQAKDLPLFIGGKSMGGRACTMLAANDNVKGAIAYGYPFHPMGKPENLRIAHLQSLIRPTLIIQGDRDPFGTQQEVASYPLCDRLQITLLADAEHSFKTLRTSAFSQTDHLHTAAQKTAEFIRETLCI